MSLLNMSNPRRDYRFHLHRDHFLRHVDPKATEGLEIGAFDLPLIETGEGYCEFADYRSTEELKELAQRTKGHDTKNVVPITHVLKNGYDSIIRQFDWIAAAHVVEHIPDVIGWLQILFNKLRAGGILFLVVPDKRFTFDHFRQETSLANIVDSHRLGLARPSFAQVFDHIFNATDIFDPGIIWAGGTTKSPEQNYQRAMTAAEQSLHEYVDVHCSVFTPESFCRIFLSLQRAGAISFALIEVRATQLNQCDFSVVLRRL